MVERAVDCNKVRKDVAYTWATMNFFGISLIRKQGFPSLLRDSLACIFSCLLIWMQHVKWVCGKKCVMAQKSPEKWGNLLYVNFVQKN